MKRSWDIIDTFITWSYKLLISIVSFIPVFIVIFSPFFIYANSSKGDIEGYFVSIMYIFISIFFIPYLIGLYIEYFIIKKIIPGLDENEAREASGYFYDSPFENNLMNAFRHLETYLIRYKNKINDETFNKGIFLVKFQKVTFYISWLSLLAFFIGAIGFYVFKRYA